MESYPPKLTNGYCVGLSVSLNSHKVISQRTKRYCNNILKAVSGGNTAHMSPSWNIWPKTLYYFIQQTNLSILDNRGRIKVKHIHSNVSGMTVNQKSESRVTRTLNLGSHKHPKDDLVYILLVYYETDVHWIEIKQIHIISFLTYPSRSSSFFLKSKSLCTTSQICLASSSVSLERSSLLPFVAVASIAATLMPASWQPVLCWDTLGK